MPAQIKILQLNVIASFKEDIYLKVNSADLFTFTSNGGSPAGVTGLLFFSSRYNKITRAPQNTPGTKLHFRE